MNDSSRQAFRNPRSLCDPLVEYVKRVVIGMQMFSLVNRARFFNQHSKNVEQFTTLGQQVRTDQCREEIDIRRGSVGDVRDVAPQRGRRLP